MKALDPNFRALLNCFNSAGVRYLLIGGYAVNFHGHHRNTKDLDLWIAVSPENADLVSAALQEFGFTAASVSREKFLARGAVYSFGRAPFRVDILTAPSGVEFDGCYGRRIDATIDGIQVPVISLDDLHQNKLASGRTRDLADIENIQRKKSQKAKKKPRRKRD